MRPAPTPPPATSGNESHFYVDKRYMVLVEDLTFRVGI